ncbi:MAG TPA: hypothetical protein DHW64_10450 [Chitinophagaceae bacterium]|nr:hypothetical protein [Chitinophagaceae bacterium]
MPVTFSNTERKKLLKYLYKGRANAIGAKKLATAMGYPIGGNQVKLRTLIKECIEHDKDLIGAATGKPAGFFLISSLNELEEYLDSLENRTRSDNTRRTALLTSWNKSKKNHTRRSILRIR